MAESINDKLIKLGVSYYDGTAPAAPPIRGIFDGSTEDYNKVITNPYGEQGVTPSPAQGTLDNLPVQQPVQEQMVEIPVEDNNPVQPTVAPEEPRVQNAPYEYQTVQISSTITNPLISKSRDSLLVR